MQIIGYESGLEGLEYDIVNGLENEPEPPSILIGDKNEVKKIHLVKGEKIDYSLKNRHCAGRISEGIHEYCGNEKSPYCENHISNWVCARCTGNCDLPIANCKETHAVYIAAFSPSIFKVGVTRMPRLITRLREQGARKAAHIETVSNGRTARQIERRIASGMKDRVIAKEKLNGLGQNVNGQKWELTMSEFKPAKIFDFSYGFKLDYPPIPAKILSGEIVGVDGRFLVLKISKDNYAVDLRAITGYEIEKGNKKGEISLQSSLNMLNG